MGRIRNYINITGKLPFRLMQLAVFTTLLGRGLLYLIWDAPLRSLLWDESLMSPIVQKMGYTWSEWVTSLNVEQGIQLSIQILGGVFVILALTTLWAGKSKRLAMISLPLAVVLSFVHVLLSTKAHFYQMGQLMELTLQWVNPLLLLLLLIKNFTTKVDYVFRVAIAFTFIGHGLYAVGYYPVPGNFQDMVMNSFGVDKSLAVDLLRIAGVLDFIAALLLLFTNKKWAIIGLYYIITWGILTTFARLWSYTDLVSMEGLILRWLPETIVRWTHFLVPLALLFLWQKKLPLRCSQSDR